jgi:hypothetical protein
MQRSHPLVPTALDESNALDHVVARLQAAFPSTSPQRIRDVVGSVSDSYRDAKIRRYVAIFVERESRGRLREELIRPRESLESPSSVAATSDTWATDASTALASTGS